MPSGHRVVDLLLSAWERSCKIQSSSEIRTPWRWYPFSGPLVAVSTVAPDHLHFRLMDAYWPVATIGEGTDSIVFTHQSLLTLTPVSSTRLRSIVVWDIKTGAVIKDIMISVEGLRRIVFSGCYTVTLVTDYYKVFRTYDALDGALLCEGEILPRFDRWLGAHWGHGKSLRVVTSYATDGKLAIDIHQPQPSSIPPFTMVESFVVPPHFGVFSFSPVSFHASFVTQTEITLLDVRSSETLLRTEAPQSLYLSPGRFSPDGGFFACGTLESEIHIWKNTPDGYMPWSGLKPRFPFDLFSFSPTATSILAWSTEGVQLLDNRTRVPLSNKATSNRHHGGHLVAYSNDETWIVTARRGGDVVTVLGPHLDAPQRSIKTAMRILDIWIVGNTVFTTDTGNLVGWDLEVGAIVHTAFGAPVTEIAVTSADPNIAESFTLPTHCSWVAFTFNGTIFLYGVRDLWILYKHTMDCDVVDIRWSLHGCRLRFVLEGDVFEQFCARDVTLSEMVGQWRIVDAPEESTEGVRSRDGPLPLHGCRIQPGFGWIEDCGGRKVLWLPPNWRIAHWLDARWNGNFLAFVDGRHPVPIIIAFRVPDAPAQS